MNFYDTVTELGYEIVSKTEDIEIMRYETLGETHIIFYTKEKQITGFLRVTKDLYSVQEISHLYHDMFLTLEKNLKFFAEKSKYAII